MALLSLSHNDDAPRVTTAVLPNALFATKFFSHRHTRARGSCGVRDCERCLISGKLIRPSGVFNALDTIGAFQLSVAPEQNTELNMRSYNALSLASMALSAAAHTIFQVHITSSRDALTDRNASVGNVREWC